MGSHTSFTTPVTGDEGPGAASCPWLWWVDEVGGGSKLLKRREHYQVSQSSVQSGRDHLASTYEVPGDEPAPGSWVSYVTPPCSLPYAIPRPLLHFMELRGRKRREGGKRKP